MSPRADVGLHSWQEEKQQQRGFPWASFQLSLPGCREGYPGERAGCEGASPERGGPFLSRRGRWQRWIPLCSGRRDKGAGRGMCSAGGRGAESFSTPQEWPF